MIFLAFQLVNVHFLTEEEAPRAPSDRVLIPSVSLPVAGISPASLNFHLPLSCLIPGCVFVVDSSISRLSVEARLYTGTDKSKIPSRLYH